MEKHILFGVLVHIWLLMGGLFALLAVSLMIYDDLLIWREWLNRAPTRFVSSLMPRLKQFQFNRGRTLIDGSDGLS